MHLPWKVVKVELPQLFDGQEFDKAIHVILSSKKKINLAKVRRQSNEDKLSFVFWIQGQYDKLREMEQTHLGSPPDAKLVQAGIKKLDVFGDLNSIDALAQGDILKWDAIQELPYEVVFTKLMKMAIEGDITKKLSKMK